MTEDSHRTPCSLTSWLKQPAFNRDRRIYYRGYAYAPLALVNQLVYEHGAQASIDFDESLTSEVLEKISPRMQAYLREKTEEKVGRLRRYLKASPVD